MEGAGGGLVGEDGGRGTTGQIYHDPSIYMSSTDQLDPSLPLVAVHDLYSTDPDPKNRVPT